jgi:hypothetical protein
LAHARASRTHESPDGHELINLIDPARWPAYTSRHVLKLGSYDLMKREFHAII